LISAAGILGAVHSAQASTIGIQICENGYNCISNSGGNPYTLPETAYGNFRVAVQTGALGSDPLSIDLASTDFGGAGILTITLSATDLTAPIGPTIFYSDLVGSAASGAATLAIKGYVDENDKLYNTSGPGVTEVSSLGPASVIPNHPIALSGDGVANLVAPFALTEVVTLNVSRAGQFSIDASTTDPVPEPSTWVMMLAGFAGLGFAGVRSRSAARAIA
jgi:PEP-CTERM motif